MNIKRVLATAAMTAGLAIGLGVNANAAPVSDDFWECAAQHPDPTEFGCLLCFLRRHVRRKNRRVLDRPRGEARGGQHQYRPQRSPEKARVDAAAQPARRVAQLDTGHLTPSVDISHDYPRCNCVYRVHTRRAGPTTCRTRSPRPRFPRVPSGVAGCSRAS